MKTIDDIVKNLSIEERRKHEELIKECEERETKTIQNGKKLRQDIEKLSNVFEKLLVDIKSLHNVSQQLHEQKKEVNDNLANLNLSMIPDDWFFHA